MSTCLVLRLGDFLVYRVTTAKSRQSPKEFIVGESYLYSPVFHLPVCSLPSFVFISFHASTFCWLIALCPMRPLVVLV